MAKPTSYDVTRVAWPCSTENIKTALDSVIAAGGVVDWVVPWGSAKPTPEGSYCVIDIIWHKE